MRTRLWFIALMAALPLSLRAQMPEAQGRVSGVVAGTVYDSVAGAPLAGALVQLASESNRADVRVATTDSLGRYRIEQVPAGTYIAGFLHPVLDSLGLLPSAWSVAVGDSGITDVALAVPSGATIRRAYCGAALPGDSTGLVLGIVHDADSGAPLGGSTVVSLWKELVIDARGVRVEPQQRTARSSATGFYALCGVPTDSPVPLRAERGSGGSGFVELAVPPRDLVREDFAIGSPDTAAVVVRDTAAAGDETDAYATPPVRGMARLTGVVRSRDGRPLAGATVLLRGSPARTTTREDGSFALTQLPAGTFTLEVRALRFAPQREVVELASNRTRAVSVTLGEAAVVLENVVVYGKATPERDISGFLSRSRSGFGRFITRADIERRNALTVPDVFFGVPGVTIARTAAFGSVLLLRGGAMGNGCLPAIFVDGTLVTPAGSTPLPIEDLVTVQDIMAVEVYRGAAETPPQFQRSGCGSVVIWTGR